MIALLGKRTLLIDADLRCPNLHDIFGLVNDRGLSTLLQSQCDAPPATFIRQTSIPTLSVLTSGPEAASSAHLLHSLSFPDLLRRLKDEYEFVLIDTPPVLQIADARIIGRFTDGVMLVTRSSHTTREAAAAAQQRFAADQTRVVGMVLNDWKATSSASPNYYNYARAYGKAVNE